VFNFTLLKASTPKSLMMFELQVLVS